MMARTWMAAIAVVSILGVGAARGAAPCAGDCNGDGAVFVNELLRMVNISLGNAALSTCAAGDANQDGELTVAEIVTAVTQALNGCGAAAPCTAESCRPCGAADTRCQGAAGGFYCCTLSGSLFAGLDGANGCESSGIYPNGCWTAPGGPCHSEFICLAVNSPTPTESATPSVTATPSVSTTPTPSTTPTVTQTPSATQTPPATGTATATPTVQTCDSAQTTACEAQCGTMQLGCCFNPTPAASGSPTPVISCFDPGIDCDGTDCPTGWYGFTVCGGQGMYSDACQIESTPGATATATPTGAAATATATATASDTPVLPVATATATDTPVDPAATPTATDTPVDPAATATATATSTPAAPTTTPTTAPESATATATATPTATGSPAAACPAGDRALNVTNSAGQTVWIGSTGASVAPTCDCPDCTTTSCIVSSSLVQDGMCKCAASDASFSGTIVCPGASTPDPGYQYCACAGSVSCGDAAACNGTPQTCYWTVPAPTSSTGSGSVWALADGDSALFCLPPPPMVQQASNPVWWNGTLFARTGCDATGAYCATGDCTDSANSGCPAGTGGQYGHAIFEVTMQTAIPDTYDVSIINGANVAIAGSPMGTAESAPPGFAPGYWCGAPGSGSPTTGVSACTWAIDSANIPTPTPGTPTPGPTPTPPDYRTTLLQTSCPAGRNSTGNECYVACTSDADCAANQWGNTHCLDGACQCLSDADCSGGNLCGTQRAPFVVPGLQQLCGSFAGWWTADVICSTAAGLGITSYGALDCSPAMQDLLGCTGTNAASCYNSAGQDNADCCGCATDASNPLSASWPSLPPGSQCYDNNPTWASQVQPLLVFLKEGCPTAYTYPFDDPTSTFNCSTAGANMMGYQVTFLPLPTPSGP